MTSPAPELIREGITYQRTGAAAQTECSHDLRNRADDECARCGSRKHDGRWVYLTPDWFRYFKHGGTKPVKVAK